MNLFDLIEAPKREGGWQAEPPPQLDGIKEIFLNFETNGLRWYAGDRPIACSITYGDKTQYLPWGHNGGNLDEAVVKRWAQRELRGKHIINTNTRFDIHMSREWGVDLEEQNNTVADVGHYAALLDDHRDRFALDLLIPDFLGHPPAVPRIDESRMASYHAADAAPRAMYQTSVVRELRDVMMPMMEKENLGRVRKLEEDVIFVVCECEKNGAFVDVERLNLWTKQSEFEVQRIFMEIYRATGLKMDFTNADWEKLFIKLNIPFGGMTATGRPSFTDLILKQIDHPLVKLARRGARLKSLRSKYLLKYLKNAGADGILRYSLHQLREPREGDIEEAGEAGTGFGRFSSTGVSRTEGTNIQQTIKVLKQIQSFGDEYIIRELHIAKEGEYLSSDAMQIEYRLFAHEANNPSIIKAYQENPLLSFHKFMWEEVKKYQPGFTYRQQKDLNFAKIYGAGIKKLALMLEFITKAQFAQLVQENASFEHPLLASTVEINNLYNRVIPEVKPLNDRAMAIAKDRGYVKTLLGRRGRFPGGDNVHKALNRRIQGSGADIMKVKMVELHKERKNTGFVMRFPVHDSVDGDATTPETADKVREILNRQSFPTLRVPILWELKTGKNWRACGDD